MDERRALDRTLLLIAVGYRVIAWVWLLLLALIALSGPTEVERQWVVGATVLVVGLWTVATSFAGRRRPSLLTSHWWLAADVVLAVALLFSADWAGTGSFHGGYPASVAFIALLRPGVAWVVVAAAALSVGAVVRILGGTVTGSLTSVSSTVIVYPFIAVGAAWAIMTLRKFDELRREAEDRLEDERADRIRAEERAAMGTHLHDSVLQTLALIQRTEDRPKVDSLARKQERELREWLHGGEKSPSWAGALESVCADVEDLYGVRVDLVTVGDRAMDESLDALLGAARESMVNAAKHAAVSDFSTYSEITDDQISVFVRDRGIGFDFRSVSADRRGLSDSVMGRMERTGGEAVVTSTPGKGTEVMMRIGL